MRRGVSLHPPALSLMAARATSASEDTGPPRPTGEGRSASRHPRPGRGGRWVRLWPRAAPNSRRPSWPSSSPGAPIRERHVPLPVTVSLRVGSVGGPLVGCRPACSLVTLRSDPQAIPLRLTARPCVSYGRSRGNVNLNLKGRPPLGAAERAGAIIIRDRVAKSWVTYQA